MDNLDGKINKNGKIHLDNGLCNGAISNKILVIVMGFTNASWHTPGPRIMRCLGLGKSRIK